MLIQVHLVVQSAVMILRTMPTNSVKTAPGLIIGLDQFLDGDTPKFLRSIAKMDQHGKLRLEFVCNISSLNTELLLLIALLLH